MSFFDALGPSRSEQEAAFEIVEGRFLCQRSDCWEATNEAKYFEKELFLTWKCPAGHICKVEDIEL